LPPTWLTANASAEYNCIFHWRFRSDMRRRLILLIVPIILASASLVFWSLHSQSGLQTLLGLAGGVTGGRLEISGVTGRLSGPLEIETLRWRDETLQISLTQVHIDWSPDWLSQGRMSIKTLEIDSLRIDSIPGKTSSKLPDKIGLPFAVDIEKLQISRLLLGEQLLASTLTTRFNSDDKQYRLSDLRARSDAVQIHGSAQLATRTPFRLEADIELQGQLENRPLALALHADGPLERLPLALTARAGVEGQAQVLLTPFAPTAFASAHIKLHNINPAAWQDGLPNARIAITSDLTPSAAGIAGSFAIVNQQPGRLDQQALPFSQLSGELAWHEEQLNFPKLHATLAGQGELTGKGDWLADGVLQLTLQARRLDAAQLFSRLRPTQLSGPLSASIGKHRQSLNFALKDSCFALHGEASHANSAVDLKKIEITAGEASLHGSAALQLDEQRFSLDATLRHFDPSRFAHTPAARINAQISASGQFTPQAPLAQLAAQFTLQDSQYNAQPLSGRGNLKLAWPHVSAINLAFALGQNQINANGAFGRPGEQVKIRIDAPKLAAFGAEGGITGRLALGGTSSQPTLDAELRADQLGLPGVFRLYGLNLKAGLDQGRTTGKTSNAPLRLDLALDRLEDGARNELVQHIRLTGDGKREQHQLQLAGDLPSGEQFTLAAAGGLFDKEWRGQLSELQLTAKTPARNIRLAGVAPLHLSSTSWSLGPLRLNGTPLDWQASIEASSKNQRLSLNMQASGARIGRLAGQLNGAMKTPWQLAENQAWQGRLTAAIADLDWLGELIGEGWHSAGRLDGELQLAGTPAQPLLNGQVRGKALSIRQDEGLSLTDGELHADITNNLLRVRQLGFNSPHRPLPRPLRQALGAAAGQHETAGRLEISGEFRVDRSNTDAQGALDIRLERVAAWQRADQWLSLSGQGRLGWQKDKTRDNSGKADATSSWVPGNTLSIQGQLGVDAGYWQLAPSGAPRLSDDVVILHPGSGAKHKLRTGLALALEIDLGRHFLFSGAGLSSRLAGQVRLSASGRDLPRASGSIRARDGRFEAYGQQLEIERGILTFQGLPDNPALDVHAVRKGLAVEAGVQVSGTAQKPVIRLTSDPELPDAEKLSWLILGHGPESVGSGDATVLLSAASSLLGNNSANVVQQLKQTFGFDEFGVRPGREWRTPGSQPDCRKSHRHHSGNRPADSEHRQTSVGQRHTELRTLAGLGGKHRQTIHRTDPPNHPDRPGRQRQRAGYFLYPHLGPAARPAERAKPGVMHRWITPAAPGSPVP
jgi:translocation and assembly module TamB